MQFHGTPKLHRKSGFGLHQLRNRCKPTMSSPHIPGKHGLQIQQNHQAAHTQPAPESFRSGSADPSTRYTVLRCVIQQSCLATLVLLGVFLGRVTLLLS
jgi:hypothetical protein